MICPAGGRSMSSAAGPGCVTHSASVSKGTGIGHLQRARARATCRPPARRRGETGHQNASPWSARTAGSRTGYWRRLRVRHLHLLRTVATVAARSAGAAPSCAGVACRPAGPAGVGGPAAACLGTYSSSERPHCGSRSPHAGDRLVRPRPGCS